MMDSETPLRMPACRLTMNERRELIEIFFECGKNYSKTARLFSERHERRIPVQLMTVRALIKKWRSTNSIEDIKRPQRFRPITEGAIAGDVLHNVCQNQRASVRVLARECETSPASVYRILRNNGYHSFRDKQVQMLHDGDPEKRYAFCSWFLDNVNVWDVLFSDESLFRLHGVDSQTRSWATSNPLQINASHTVHSPTLMVWAGIMGSTVFGPYFFQGNVNGKMS